MKYSLVSLLAFTFVACKKSDSSTQDTGPRRFASEAVQTWDDVADLSAESTAIRSDLKDIFCVHVYKLPLQADFDQELAVLCENNKPTENFARLDRYAGRIGSFPRSIKLGLEHGADGFTSGVYATVYRTPIAPKWVRSARIPHYMVATSLFDYVKLDGEVISDLTETLGGDLQFGKWRLSYRSEVQTPTNTSFSNARHTELNSYQVEGGNPDIGIGAEHLIDAGNPDFKYYNTTTITIGNADGGSTLITIIRLSVRNNGFEDLAEKVFSDIATSQATQVHDGITREDAAGHFPK